MKSMWDKLEGVLLIFMSVMWTVGLTAISFGVAIWAIKWVFKLVGVL